MKVVGKNEINPEGFRENGADFDKICLAEKLAHNLLQL